MPEQDWRTISDPIERAYRQITQGGMQAERITEGVPEGVVIFRVTDSHQSDTLYTPYLPHYAIQGFATLADAIAYAQGKPPQQPGRYLVILR